MSWLTDGGSKRCCGCSNGRERETSSPSPLFLSFFVVLFVPSLSSVCFFLLLFFVCSFSSFSHVRSLSFLTSVSPLLPFLFFFSFCSLFIGKKRSCPFASTPWERVLRAAGPPPPVTARRRFLAFGRASGRSASGFGWWSRARGFGLVGARRESGRFKEENHFSLPVAGSGGRRKGNNAVQNGTVRSSFFFFFLFYE